MPIKILFDMSHIIQANDRVFHPDYPEYGYGIIKMIDESLLSDERICQISFEWVPGLIAVSEKALRKVPKLASGFTIQSDEWSGHVELQRRLGAALVMAENSQSAAFIRSFTMPLPHQAFLLEKILAHRRFGHVIADDVGMGKTIEAGLIMATLRQRDPQCRILVLCPAGVVLQWQDEMDEHFGLPFSIAGRDFSLDRSDNWKSHTLVLASLDTLKQEKLRDLLKTAPPFDLVVCDEAHRLTARREFLSNDLLRTQNYRFVEWLVHEHVVNWEASGDGSPRSPRLILMSATPHQGDDLRFAYLLQLARPDKIDAENAVITGGTLSDSSILEDCLTRTAKKRAVDWSGKPIFLGHETRTLDVSLTESEKIVINRLARYVRSDMVFKESKGEALVRALAMHTFQKIAASSWAALEAALAARLNKALGKMREKNTSEQATSMAEEFDFSGGEAEIIGLENLLQSVRSIESDSKWQAFQDLIQPGGAFREKGDRILIFTQYRITQSWLAEKLSAAGERVMQIHGGLNLDERKAQRIAFESEGTILISTEAGSEGANLHRKCHLMVNYDLPWNPMRLLQRIGRLDRYGQKHRVKVANLKASESWDSMISQKIEAKLNTVQASMGLVADEDYRAMILGSIHESINIPEIMKACSWDADDKKLDDALDHAVKALLSRKSSLDRLFRESLGMPENYGQGSPELTSDDFRQVFAWAALAHGIILRETRTSDNKLLKGVFHFTLPASFRGGLRASRECHLVFDREQFSVVRNASLGRVRGQEIKPSLAGFGDSVTDWFFRSALQATGASQFFKAKTGNETLSGIAWLLVFVARWKVRVGWAGPDAIFTFALDDAGNVIRMVQANEVMRFMQTMQSAFPNAHESCIPNLSIAQGKCRELLRTMLDVKNHAATLNLQEFCIISIEH